MYCYLSIVVVVQNATILATSAVQESSTFGGKLIKKTYDEFSRYTQYLVDGNDSTTTYIQKHVPTCPKALG